VVSNFTSGRTNISYLLNTEATTWLGAQQQCNAQNGTLVAYFDATEQVGGRGPVGWLPVPTAAVLIACIDAVQTKSLWRVAAIGAQITHAVAAVGSSTIWHRGIVDMRAHVALATPPIRVAQGSCLGKVVSNLCYVLLTQVEVESFFTSSGELTTLYYYKYWIGLNSVSWPAFG
jgi:hypothetical protein